MLQSFLSYKRNLLLFLGITFLSFSFYAFGDGSGRVARTSATSSGCSCHGSSSSSVVSLSVISGSGSFTVAPSSVTSFTVTVSHPTLANAGINIAVKTDATSSPGTAVGTMAGGTGLKSSGSPSELTHTSPMAMNGGSASFTFQWTAPSTPGTYYLRAIGLAGNGNNASSGDLWNWMTVQPITVVASSVTVTSPNGTEQFCAGNPATIKWSSAGVTNVNIDLSSDGGTTYPTNLATNVPAAGGLWSWNIPLTQVEGTNFRVKVSDASKPTTNDASNSSFSIFAKTGILSPPASLDLCLQSNAVFQVSAVGSNLNYQWKKNGVDIQNAYTRSLYINNVTAADSGAYRCMVAGSCDSALSDIAYLKIKPSPKITSQPKGDTVCINQPFEIALTAEGTSLTYYWSKDGNPVQGGNGPKLTFAKVALSDSGRYSCYISGACLPKINSDTVILVVYKPIAIATQPTNKTAKIGDNVTFSIEAVGTKVKYQWKKGGTIIPTGTGSSLVLKNVSPADTGSYDCEISNRCNKMTSLKAVLTLVKADSAVIQLASNLIDFQNVPVGAKVDSVLANIIENNSPLELIINTIDLVGQDASDFSISNISFPASVKVNDTRSFIVRFQPKSPGTKTAALVFKSNAKNSATLNLMGYGISEGLSVTGYDFGIRLIGAISNGFTKITNIGVVPITIDSLFTSSTDAQVFKLMNSINSKVLNPNESIDLNWTFAPSEIKTYNAQYVVKNSLGESVMFALRGAGTATSVDDLNEYQNIIYPNPANNELHIRLNSKETNVRVTVKSIIGITVKSMNYSGDSEEIVWDLKDNSGIPCQSGVYELVVEQNQHIYARKFIINR